MPADLLARWTPAGGTPFPFSGSYQIASLVDSGIERRIPSAETGDDGEFASAGLASPRTVTLSGTLHADDLEALRALQQSLATSLSSRAEGRLYGHSDRFLSCRVTRFDPGEDDGLLSRKWSATFRASAYPFWQDDAESAYVAAAGSIVYPALGAVPAPIRLEIDVSAVTVAGTISVAHPCGVATIRPSATGLYVIDGAAGTVTRASVDAIADFYGVFPKIDPAASALVVTTSSGAAYSSATAYARALWENL